MDCGHLFAVVAVMVKEALIEELARLLDAGELILTAFPKLYPNAWPLELPDNVSPDMIWYADSVAWMAVDRERYLDFCQKASTDFLAGRAEAFEAGLLGWRAIGVLR